MAVVMDDPEVVPDLAPTAGRSGRRVAPALFGVLAVMATASVAGSIWYGNRIDPLSPPGTRWRHGGVPVRTGSVQGLTVAFLTAEKDGTLRDFRLEGLPADAELLATKVYFLEEAGGPAEPLAYGCRPTGLNFFVSSDGRTVSGRFEEVDGARFREGDTLQLIAYVRFDEAGPFEIPARVGVRYAVGPVTRTTVVRDTTSSGLVSNDPYPAGVTDGPDCRLPNDTRGGA